MILNTIHNILHIFFYNNNNNNNNNNNKKQLFSIYTSHKNLYSL